MSDMLDFKQSRKWQITINNPLTHGFDHERIISIMSQIKGKSLYWCMCDEEGDECETLHTHIFIYRSSPFTARQINNLFPNMHRDACYGTARENRAYILKDGEKYHKDEAGHYEYVDSSGHKHIGINHSDTFHEFGQCPDEHQGKSRDSDIITAMIKDGCSNEDIVDAVSSSYKELDKIDRVRSMYRDSKFRDSWRDLDVTYIFGATGTGKTRGVMEKYGYLNVYRVTDYKHPFDTYNGQDVIVFEEFRGGLKHGDMLNYLDGYPLLLPCRYFDRQACYTKVFLISNIPPDKQYTSVDLESREAFFRRINLVVEYDGTGRQTAYPGVEAYRHRHSWAKCGDNEVIPEF